MLEARVNRRQDLFKSTKVTVFVYSAFPETHDIGKNEK